MHDFNITFLRWRYAFYLKKQGYQTIRPVSPSVTGVATETRFSNGQARTRSGMRLPFEKRFDQNTMYRALYRHTHG